MGRSSNIAMYAIKPAFAVGAVLAAVYAAAYVWLVCMAPVSFRELDLNRDGHVSFDEAAYAASFGERVVQVNGKQCTEYFAYKDGLPLKVQCGSGA